MIASKRFLHGETVFHIFSFYYLSAFNKNDSPSSSRSLNIYSLALAIDHPYHRLSLLCNHGAGYVPISVLVMIPKIRWFFNTLGTPALMHAATMWTPALSATLRIFILESNIFYIGQRYGEAGYPLLDGMTSMILACVLRKPPPYS